MCSDDCMKLAKDVHAKCTNGETYTEEYEENGETKTKEHSLQVIAEWWIEDEVAKYCSEECYRPFNAMDTHGCWKAEENMCSDDCMKLAKSMHAKCTNGETYIDEYEEEHSLQAIAEWWIEDEVAKHCGGGGHKTCVGISKRLAERWKGKLCQ